MAEKQVKLTNEQVNEEMNKMFNYIDNYPNKIKNLIGFKYNNLNTNYRAKLVKTPEYLFVFNDCYLNHKTAKVGKGSAAVRVYNNYSGLPIPRSFGIPLGYYKLAYRSLKEGILQINECIMEMIFLLSTYHYENVLYPIGNIDNPILGFACGYEAKREIMSYITKCLLKLAKGGKFHVANEDFILDSYTITDDIINSQCFMYESGNINNY